jgi:putative ABC transport system permease protein
MELILKIAWRNILRHKGKSLIIGVILFIGAFLMTLGNGIIAGMDRGLEKNIVNGFLGDIVIISDKEKSDNILFKMYGEPVESISNYKEIKKVLGGEKYIKGILPAGKNTSMVINEDDGEPAFSMLLGVDLDAYRAFFPDNFTTIEGAPWEKGKSGILIPAKTRSDIYDQMNQWFIPKGSELKKENLSDDAKANLDTIVVKQTAVFMGMNQDNSTTDIRLDVSGIIRFRALNTFWGHFSIMDIESYRKCLGYISASDAAVEISKDKKELLSMDSDNLDAMFGKESVYVSDKGDKDISSISLKRKDNEPASADLDIEDGTYNIIMIKLADGTSLDDGLKKINKTLSDAKLGVRAVTWKKASGFIGNMASIISIALFFIVSLVFIVAIIIIVNTLSMAAIERTTEIGMMRAVGARKSFIEGMFISETTILSGLFGGLGILTGFILVSLIPLLHITSSNDLVQLMYGGDTLMPVLTFGRILLIIFELLIVTIITVIYPVIVARRITPLDAISRD